MLPPARAATLRQAIEATTDDPAFRDEAKRMNLDIRSMAGAETAGIVQRFFGSPQPVIERVRAAGFTPLLASYAYCLVFPAVAAVRLARRGAAGSDVFPLPRPLNAALLGVQAAERAFLRLCPLPFGSSVVLVARKAAA